MEPPHTCWTEAVKTEPGRRVIKSVLTDFLGDDKLEERLDQIKADLTIQNNLINNCSARIDDLYTAITPAINKNANGINRNANDILENSNLLKCWIG